VITGDGHPGHLGPDLDALDRVSIGTLVQHLLLPQHHAVRAALGDLGRLTASLAPGDQTRSRVVRRAESMVGELSVVIADHFDHEERHVFPRLVAGHAPIQQLGDLHDHHRDIDARLLRLRALTAELRSAAEVTDGLVVLLEGLTSLGDLAHVHHAIERRLLDRYR
jgi:iron-sulfur cluster repair protein YtfE (RIC family)